jgi:hypothetical protein
MCAGIPYGPEVTSLEASSNTASVERGLAFGEFPSFVLWQPILTIELVCYQSNLAAGFQFMQRIWADNAKLVFQNAFHRKD